MTLIYTTEAQVQSIISSILSGQAGTANGVAPLDENGQINPIYLANALSTGNGGAIGTADSPPEDSINRLFYPNSDGTYTNFSGVSITLSDGLNLIIGNDTDGFEKIVVPIDLVGYTQDSNIISYIEGVSLNGNQLFDLSSMIVDRYRVNNDGTLSFDGTTGAPAYKYASVPLYGMGSNTNINVYGYVGAGVTGNKAYRFLDEDDVPLTFGNLNNSVNINGTNLSIPEGAVKLEFTVKQAADTEDPSLYSAIMVNYGLSKLTYESYVEPDFDYRVDTINGVKVGNLRKEDSLPGSLTEQDVLDLINNKSNPIVMVGDSLTAQFDGDYLASITGRSVTRYGYGGRASTQIRDYYLNTLSSEYSKTTVFWVGRNNFYDIGLLDTIINDLQRMINAKGDDNFIILTPPTGQYPSEYIGTERRAYLEDLWSTMKRKWGDRVLDAQSILREAFDFSLITLQSSFTQPSVGANVQITLNDTSSFTASDEIVIGFFSQSSPSGESVTANRDEYTVISVDSPTLVTIRLDVSNRIAPGASVNNFTTTNTEVAIHYLNIAKTIDYENVFIRGVSADSVRFDDVHYTDETYQYLGKFIAVKLKSLGI